MPIGNDRIAAMASAVQPFQPIFPFPVGHPAAASGRHRSRLYICPFGQSFWFRIWVIILATFFVLLNFHPEQTYFGRHRKGDKGKKQKEME